MRDRNVLLAGTVIVATLLVAGKGVPALRAWEEDRALVATEIRMRLGEAEQAAMLLETTRDSAAVRERRLASLRNRMIVAASPEAAAASLAALLERLAREEKVQISALTLRPDTVTRAGITQVGVRIAAESDVGGVLALLFAAETHDTLIIVREFSLSQPEPMASPDRPEALRFELHVRALARISSGRESQ